MGVLAGSSRLDLRLSSYGKEHGFRNCVVHNSEHQIERLGREAEELRGRVSDDYKVSRPFKAGRVDDLDACRKLLKRSFDESKHRVILGPRVVVGTASGLSPLEKRTLKEVVKAAGARKVDLLECVILSVLGSGRNPSEAEGHLVLDLGAGCGEIALVSSGKVQVSRSVPEIGRRIDQAIVEALKEKLCIVVSVEQAEELKKELGSAVSPLKGETRPAYGCDGESGLPCRREVTSELVYRAIQPVLEELAEETRQVLKSLPSGFVHDLARHGLLLVGGVAKLRGLDRYLEDFTRLKVEVPEHPDRVARTGLDKLLETPEHRKALLEKAAVLHPHHRRGARRTEKLAGLMALALLLVATYFPARQMDANAAWQTWTETLTPLLSTFNPPDEQAISSKYQTLLAEQERRVSNLQQENHRLREAGKLEQAPPAWAQASSMLGTIVARAPENWNDQFLVDLGSNDGVRKGMAVTNGQGLIGQVVKVQDESAYVGLIGRDQEQFGATVSRTGSNGVLRADGASRFTLTYLDPNDGVKLGDTVKTNGLDGIYPSGVPVGKITNLRRDENSAYLIAEVEVAAQFDEADNVLLLAGKGL